MGPWSQIIRRRLHNDNGFFYRRAETSSQVRCNVYEKRLNIDGHSLTPTERRNRDFHMDTYPSQTEIQTRSRSNNYIRTAPQTSQKYVTTLA